MIRKNIQENLNLQVQTTTSMNEYCTVITVVCSRIKELRIRKGMKVQDLAYLCDIERSNLSRIEAGKSNLTIKTLCKICNALECSVSDLF